MKVLVVGTGGALGGSGITTMADQMVRTLHEMGHEPTRLVAGDRPRRRPRRLNAENVVAAVQETWSVARASRRHDIVWLHTFGVPTLPALRALVQVVAVRALGRPIIVELHAFALADQMREAGVPLRAVLRLLGALARRLVVLQEEDAAAVIRIVGADRVAILPNWVDVPAEPLPLPPGPPYVALFVGGLVERKGVRELLEAMRLLKDLPIRLRVVGDAGDEGDAVAANFREMAADLVEEGAVAFLGAVPNSAVLDELSEAHLLVLPSRAEGIPVAVLEALARGRCIVVADGGTIGAVVNDRHCGVALQTIDATSIAQAIRRAVASPAELADAGLRAHEVALNQFSVPRAARHLEETLRDA